MDAPRAIYPPPALEFCGGVWYNAEHETRFLEKKEKGRTDTRAAAANPVYIRLRGRRNRGRCRPCGIARGLRGRLRGGAARAVHTLRGRDAELRRNGRFGGAARGTLGGIAPVPYRRQGRSPLRGGASAPGVRAAANRIRCEPRAVPPSAGCTAPRRPGRTARGAPAPRRNDRNARFCRRRAGNRAP